MPGFKRNVFWGLFACLLLASQTGFAQKITLNGRVLDAKTALPIEGVGVQLRNSGKTAITDAQGSFSIQTDTVFSKATLIFSHISYEKFSLQLKSGQTELAISLSPKTNTLSEVKITASGKLKPAKVRPETVLDFAITKNRLFVLGWETGQKNPTLQVLNLYNDSLILNCRLPVYADKLFVDCLENLHVFSDDQVYQVYSDSVSLSLYKPVPRTEFEQIFKPCLAVDNRNAYFRRNINKGVVISFYSVNQETHENKLFRTVADEAVLTMQQSEDRFQFIRAKGGEGPPSDGSPNLRIAGSGKIQYEGPTAESLSKAGFEARKGRGMANNMGFAQKVMFEAPYVPLLKIGKNICLFDHVNGKIEFYSSDSLTRVVPVNYHLQSGWEKQIVVDAAQEKVFVLCSRNGLFELKKLDLQSGELENTYRIPNPFAGKITVHNGLVYFLYKDPAKNKRQFLYKAPLAVLKN